MKRGTDSNKAPSQGSGGKGGYRGWRAILNPLWCYYGFLATVVATTVFGLMMVFSSSAVDLVAQGSSPWSQVIRQSIYAVFGLLLALLAVRISVDHYRNWSTWFLIVSQGVQLLTRTPLGRSANGNEGWISIGGVSMQPAELLKLALCLWLPQALIEAQRQVGKDSDLKSLAKAYAKPAAGFIVSFLLIMLGKDLGTAMIIVIIGFVDFLVSRLPKS